MRGFARIIPSASRQTLKLGAVVAIGVGRRGVGRDNGRLADVSRRKPPGILAESVP